MCHLGQRLEFDMKYHILHDFRASPQINLPKPFDFSVTNREKSSPVEIWGIFMMILERSDI